MTEVSELLNVNEVDKPLLFTEVTVPDELYEASGPDFEKVFNYLKDNSHKEVKRVLTELDGERKSDHIQFRGFIRSLNVDGYTGVWDQRYNAKLVDDNLHKKGHEMHVGESGDAIRTTPFPEIATQFAVPRDKNDVGFLLLYDNSDGFFNDKYYFDWAAQTELKPESSLRDRLHSVVVIKRENKKPTFVKFMSDLKNQLLARLRPKLPSLPAK